MKTEHAAKFTPSAGNPLGVNFPALDQSAAEHLAWTAPSVRFVSPAHPLAAYAYALWAQARGWAPVGRGEGL